MKKHILTLMLCTFFLGTLFSQISMLFIDSAHQVNSGEFAEIPAVNASINDTACSVSVAHSITGWKAKVYDAPAGVNGWMQISASNSFPTQSYTQIATFDYNENANTNKAFDIFFSTDYVGLTAANPKVQNYVGLSIPYASNEDYAVLFSKVIVNGEEGRYRFALEYGDDHIFIYKNGVKLNQQQNAFNIASIDNFATVDLIVGDTMAILVVEEELYNTEVRMSVFKDIAPVVEDLTNECPSNTVNLNDAHKGITPLGTSLVWFTNNTHTGSALSASEISEAVAGTYYAFYYDSEKNCYSLPSDAVTVNIAPCPSSDNCVDGCNNNTFLNTSNPNTIEYDNIISGFHGTIIKESGGGYKIWGQATASNGIDNLFTPTEIIPANGYNYTGQTLKAAMGTAGNSSGNAQFALLTTDGLYVWGTAGYLVSTGVKSTSTFGKVDNTTIMGANTYGLPNGVNPQDIKMMFGSYLTLAIVTCTGDAYVLSSVGNKNGDGTLQNDTNNKTWHKVMKNATTPLTRVVAVRGQASALMALTDLGEIYTWGTDVYLGDGTNKASQTYATKMTLPSGVVPKMIGMTITKPNATIRNNSHYLLGVNGNMYSLGANDRKQLGTFSGGANTDESKSWEHVKSTNSFTNMTNIVWISPNEHDDQGLAAVQVLTADGKMWSWGVSNNYTLGLQDDGTMGSAQPAYSFIKGINPRYMTGGLDPSFKILAVETGGHVSTIFKDCDYKLGYIGHNANGSYGISSTSTSSTYRFDGAKFSNLCALPLPPLPIVKDLKVCPGNTVDLMDAVLNTPSSGYVLEWWTTPNRMSGTQVANPESVDPGIYYAFYWADDIDDCVNLEGEKVVVSYYTVIDSEYNACICNNKTPATGTPNGFTKVGITTQSQQATWPENIPNGFIALESKDKGMVISRVENSDKITDPKEGMLIYDIAAQCVKLYNGTVWNCIKNTCD